MDRPKLLALPIELADAIAQYVLECPTPLNTGAGKAYRIVEALKQLGPVPEANEACGPDGSREAKAVEPQDGAAEIL